MRKLKLILIMSAILFSSSLWAQVTVSGNVTDKDGEALIGVSIVIEGTTQGTITDVNGNYSLDVPGSEAVLVFSFIGFKATKVAVGNQSTINVVLEDDAKQLQEVVVSALGFEQDKDNMGSTFSTVQTDAVTRSGEAMFGTTLAAKAANVQISQTTGDPGAGTTIRIRGANSITGETSPLIIVDGIPISNTTFYGETIGGNGLTGGTTGGTVQQSRINDINPNDIESITILKGASAASLWGSRASNGVIVITTKSGKQGKLNIGYKATVSFDKVHERIPMQNTYGQGRSGNQSESQAESWGDYIPDRSGGPNDVDQTGAFFTSESGNVIYPIIDKNSFDTFVDENWDAAFQTGGFVQHDLTVSGGNDRATFFSSISRLDQEGIIRNSDYDRTNLRFNTNFALSDWLNFSTKAGYVNSNSNRIQQSSNTAGLLLGLLRTAPDFDNRDYIGVYTNSAGQEFPLRHRAYRSQIGASSSSPAYNNPQWTIFEQSSTSELDRFTMAGEMNVTPNEWLQFTARGGVDSYTELRTYFFPIHSAGSRAPGQYAEDVIKETEYNFDLIGQASFELSQDANLQVTAGWNINDRSRNITAATITGFLVNVRKETADLNTAAEASTYDNSKRFIKSNRGYGLFTLDLFNQLTLNGSGTIEAASTVKGTFFYPAFDAAWRLSEIVDLSGAKITFAKLRASWGRVGIQPLAHRFETTAETDFAYTSYDSELGISLHGGGFRLNDDLGNPNLEPELKTEWEIGTDLRFFSDKLSLSMTYYQNEIEGVLIPVDLTPSFGFDTQYANAADMENKGFEAELNYEILQRGDWVVSTMFNWSRNKNEVTRLLGTETINLSPGASVSSRAIVGEQLGALYGTGSLTNDDGSFALDANGFPQLTPSPIVLGDPNPDWRANLGLNVSWKALTLNILFEHSQGGEFSPRTQWVLRRFGTTKETANTFVLEQDLVNFAGNTIPAGTRVRGNIEDFGGGPVLLDESWYRTGIGGGFGDNQAYNFSIVDATFTRLREISLSYALNSPWFQEKTKLNSIIFTATGRNLALWTDLVGVDPQVNQTGVGNAAGLDYFTNPSTESVLFSIALNF